MQVVAQLELQLQKERDRLQSMMDHLNRARQQQQQQQQQQQTPPPKQSPVKTSGSRPPPAAPSSESSHLPLQQQQHHRMSPSLAALVSATMRGVMNPATAAPHHHLLLHPPTSAGAQTAMSQQSQSQSRRRLSEKPNLAPNSGKLLYINTPGSNFCWMSFFRLYYTDTIIIVIHMAGSECPVLSSSAPTRCLCVACCCARAKQIICFLKKRRRRRYPIAQKERHRALGYGYFRRYHTKSCFCFFLSLFINDFTNTALDGSCNISLHFKLNNIYN